MPICKNDPSRKYKGTEPSPKGLGWCAHADRGKRDLDQHRQRVCPVEDAGDFGAVHD